MGFLKGLAVSILSLILFLTLGIFSIAYMLHGTVLDSGFVLEQVDKIPISDIAGDVSEAFIGEQLSQEMPFVKDVALNVLEKQEPWIKKEIKAAVNTGYDYLMDETDELNIVIPLSELKENLKNSLWEETILYLKEQTEGMTEAEISDYLQNIVRQIPADILPPDLAALPNNLRNLAVEQYLRDLVGLNKIMDLPPEITTPILNQAKTYFDRFLEDFTNQMPDTYTLNESTLSRDTMDSLQKAKTAVGIFQTYYPWMIVLMVVLAVLIFLVNMNIRATARALGTNLLIFGIIDLVGVILMKVLPIMDWASSFVNQDIPASLNTWVSGLISDVSSVALPLSIGLLAAGIVLLVVSFIIPKKEVVA